MQNTTCVACKSKFIEIFDVIEHKTYWNCSTCKAKFLDPIDRLEPKLEKKRYQQHKNNVDDHSYKKFLSKLSNPLLKKLSIGDEGLDFGCGPGPALANILSSEGFKIDLYDPFFFPDKKIFLKKYNFITCSETIEHFFNPYDEFINLDKLLLKSGWLGVMTCFMKKNILFEKWHYRRDPTHVVFYAEETFEVIANQRNWIYEVPSKDIVLFYKK